LENNEFTVDQVFDIANSLNTPLKHSSSTAYFLSWRYVWCCGWFREGYTC